MTNNSGNKIKMESLTKKVLVTVIPVIVLNDTYGGPKHYLLISIVGLIVTTICYRRTRTTGG